MKHTSSRQRPALLILLWALCLLVPGCAALQPSTQPLMQGHALVIKLPGLEGAENQKKISKAVEGQWHRSKSPRTPVQILSPSSNALLEKVQRGLLLARKYTDPLGGTACNDEVPTLLTRLQDADQARMSGNGARARELVSLAEREVPCQNQMISPQLLAGLLLLQGLLDSDVSLLAQAVSLDQGLHDRMVAFPTIQRRLEAAATRIEALPRIPVLLPLSQPALQLLVDGNPVHDTEMQLVGNFHLIQWLDGRGKVLSGRALRLVASKSPQPVHLLSAADLPPPMDEARQRLLGALQERILPSALKVALQYVLHEGDHPWILVVGPSAPPKESWALPGTFKSIDVLPSEELKLHQPEAQGRPSARSWQQPVPDSGWKQSHRSEPVSN